MSYRLLTLGSSRLTAQQQRTAWEGMGKTRKSKDQQSKQDRTDPTGGQGGDKAKQEDHHLTGKGGDQWLGAATALHHICVCTYVRMCMRTHTSAIYH